MADPVPAAAARTLGALGFAPGACRGEATPDTAVDALTVDSRAAAPGTVFFALKGARFDGAEFAPYALRQGASAVVLSPEGAETLRALWDRAPAFEDLPLVIVDEPRRALAHAAAAFHGAQPPVIAATTGTNGKTSVATFLRQIWTALGRKAVNFGTTGVEGAVAAPLSHTTPEPLTLHALLADLAAQGVTHAAMEASSHGLAQYRLDGVRLSAGGLTNITRDHMDYHPTHEDYVDAKLGLFRRVLPEGAAAALNVDDPTFPAAKQAAEARGMRVIGVGEGPGAALQLLSARYHDAGQSIRFAWDGHEHEAELQLVGGFQAHNALLAAALAIGCGEDPEDVFGVLPALRGVHGRMEHVATRANGGRAYVDYAHTPDGLRAALSALRLHTPGRLVVVFGAGGDRDPGKRPLMGAAARAADVAIVTDDNPRSEDPGLIRAAIIGAIPEAEEIGDRAEAILAGMDMLGPDDRLLIAGKGHETGQIVGDAVLPFDDSEQARAAAAALDGLDAAEGWGEDA
ncbi:UDP-N-acetylmuramoyl-L-alanyl-D-glutamate--2,6-diaminopimelate ligase [Rhodovulum sp. DZ06]|uniref:UDP-N-acetylmuramoyl-L-alanyl-D-glutamate--2, 6-diaminopimelate ligase n=1 Tax=Rhodovulum sp. DZ06 TaxID=3425126 RepID=UPI003D340447